MDIAQPMNMVRRPSHVQERMRLFQSILQTWPDYSRRAAQEVFGRYDVPDEITPSRITWLLNSPWKRTVVYRTGAPHAFPYPHYDILAQTADYRIQPAAVGKLAEFSRSVKANVVWDELTAQCDSEEMNRALLNLAHDICIGHTSPPDAQAHLVQLSAGLRRHWPEKYAQGLHFGWHATETENARRVR